MSRTLEDRLAASAPSFDLLPDVEVALTSMSRGVGRARGRRRWLVGAAAAAALVAGGGGVAFATPAVQNWLSPVATYSYVASDDLGSSSCSVSLHVVPLTGLSDFSRADYLAFVAFARAHPWRAQDQGGEPAGKMERLMRANRAVQELLDRFHAAHPGVDLDASMTITSRARCVVTSSSSSASLSSTAAAGFRAEAAARAAVARRG